MEKRRYPDIGSRLLASALCAFCLVTADWIVWAFLTPGDYFANGNAWVEPSLLLVFVVGLIAGFHAVGRWRLAIQIAGIASMCYWIFVPSGWWAHGPFR
jgi:hypothetical protein